MNLKKFLSMIMVLSMTAAVFTGCGSSSDSTSDDSAVAEKKGTENNTGEEDSSEGDKEKLTFWDFHTGTEADVIQDMVNAYNQSQDKVKVEYSSVNQTDYTTTLVTTAYANALISSGWNRRLLKNSRMRKCLQIFLLIIRMI